MQNPKRVRDCAERFFDPVEHERRIREIITWHESKPTQRIQISGLTLDIEAGVFNPAYGTFATRLHDVVVSQIRPGSTCLDLGTGSGYLACAMAMCGASVEACDIDSGACVLAARNAVQNGLKVSAVHSEGLSAIPKSSSFDLIVANLPFCREPLLEAFRSSPYHKCFSAREGLITGVAEESIARLRPGGKFVFCYATSGWLAELDHLRTLLRGRWSLDLEERSTCEIRWILSVGTESKIGAR